MVLHYILHQVEISGQPHGSEVIHKWGAPSSQEAIHCKDRPMKWRVGLSDKVGDPIY